MNLARRPAMLAAAALIGVGMTALSAASASAQVRTAPAAQVTQQSWSSGTHQANSSMAEAAAAVNCPTEAFCAFQNSDFGGTQWNYNATVLPLRTWLPVSECSSASSCPAANDNITSMINNRVNATYVSRDFPAEGTATCQIIMPMEKADLSGGQTWPNGELANDTISAVRLTTVTGASAGVCTSSS